MHPNRVMFLTTSLGFGGTSVVVSLAKGLSKRGWLVDFVVVTQPENEHRVVELKRAGIGVSSLNMSKTPAGLFAFMRLLKRLRRTSPHVLHTHSVHANILGRLARIFVRVPVLISTAHNVFEGPRYREWAYRITDPLADLTTQVSQAGAERYISVKAVPKQKMVCLPNGIDLNRFFPDKRCGEKTSPNHDSSNNFTWLSIGRLTEAKNYPLLFNAFKKVSDQIPSVSLYIVGDGPLREELGALASALGLSGKIEFTGTRGDVVPMLNMADAFVLSSSWEGMPMVLLEASACQVPIVATDVGGVGEVVAHEESGYLVPPGGEQELANAMLKMMSLPKSERDEMGRKARAKVAREYEREMLVDQLNDYYMDLWEKNKRRGKMAQTR